MLAIMSIGLDMYIPFTVEPGATGVAPADLLPGANSITGQCNAMGSRLFGNATSLMGGYDFADSAHRTHVANILKLDPARIPERTGLAYDQILDAVDRGKTCDEGFAVKRLELRECRAVDDPLDELAHVILAAEVDRHHQL